MLNIFLLDFDYILLLKIKTKSMNTFTITFRNALGEKKTEDMVLNFNSVKSVFSWFENTLGLRPLSISKH